MKPAQLKSLLDSIEQLQQIMKEIAVGEADLEDEEDSYAQLYKDIDLQLDLLREQGVSVSNPNPFRTLRDWRKHSWSLGRPADRIVDVYNQYHNTLTVIERFLAHQYISLGNLPDALANELHPQALKNLLTNIQKIQGIMKQVARGTKIEDREETYSKKYRELALQFSIFQELGLAISNPNCFRSLWQFYSYWDSELESGYPVREKAVDNFYEEISSAIARALHEHEMLPNSSEDFTQKLKQLFNQNQTSQYTTTLSAEDASQQSSTDTAINSDVASNTILSDLSISRSGSTQVKPISTHKQHLQQELEGFEVERKLLHEQWKRLRKALAIETDVLTKFKLEIQEKEKKEELDQINQQIQRIEDTL